MAALIHPSAWRDSLKILDHPITKARESTIAVDEARFSVVRRAPLLRRGDGADLLEQAERVPVSPALHDLAALETVGLVTGMGH
jgi:hypothetical protein